MKVNLLFEGTPLPGYLNISPYIEANTSELQKGPLDKLDYILDKNEVEELRAVDILDYFPESRSAEILDNWLSHLKHGGKIVLGTVDLIEVSKAVANYEMDVDQANLFFHGEQKRPWDFRQTNFTLSQIVAYLEAKKLKIIKKRVGDYRCIVEAERL